MSKPLRILLLTPSTLPRVSGNAITAERWRRGLAELGHPVRVVASDGLCLAALAEHLRTFQPHLVHAHHATKSGSLLLAAGLPAVPWLVSIAGTDLSQDLDHPVHGRTTRQVLSAAACIVVQSEATHARLGAILPTLAARMVRVPKAAAFLGDEPWDLRTNCGLPPAAVLFLHPAGVRPVKGNLELLHHLAELWRLRPQVRAVFLGPPLDAAYAARFAAALKAANFAHWLPGVPPHHMPSAYRAADVVLNGSRAEGLANVLLEAGTAGVPVLAANLPANREVLDAGGGGPGGLLYDPSRPGPGGFLGQALRLVDDSVLRTRLGQAARANACRWPQPAQEAAALVAVYRAMLTGTTGFGSVDDR